jgi:FKBP12-rapamycin complex-associated protein
LFNSFFRYLNGESTSNEFGVSLKKVIVDESQKLPQIAFSNLMNKFVVSALDLLNYYESKEMVKFKIAGLIIFDSLVDINDEIMPERRIEISNHIFKVLENDKLPLVVCEPVLRTAASSIGHFARVASSSEAEFLQNFSFPLALKLLRDVKSDSHKFSGALILTQLAQNSPTLIFSRQKQVFSEVCEIVCDKNPMVRIAAAASLESVLKVIAQRESMSDYIRLALKQVDSGFSSSASEKVFGSLVILDTVMGGSIINIAEFHSTMRLTGISPPDLIWKVLLRKDWRDFEIREKVLDIIPNLARTFTSAFLQSNSYCSPNFLNFSVKHLIECIADKSHRSSAFVSLGKLHLSLSNHFRTSPDVQEAFSAVCLGFKTPFSVEALDCLGVLVNIAPLIRRFVDPNVVTAMFRGGLSIQLVESLKVIIKHIPTVRIHLLRLLLKEITNILSFRSVADKKADPSKPSKDKQKWNTPTAHIFGSKNDATAGVVEAGSHFFKSPEELIFSMHILSEQDFFPRYFRERMHIGGLEDDLTDDLLAFLHNVLLHFLDDIQPPIRKASAFACSSIVNTVVLVVDATQQEYVLLLQTIERLLIMGVGDDSDEIRTLVFSSFTPALDEALSRTSNMYCLIEALSDESLSVRAASMTVLSRVARFNTLRIMPIIRLELKRLVSSLNLTQDQKVKKESVTLLQSLVRGSDVLIVPYIEQMIGPLLTLLNDPSAEVVAAALSTVGELAVASPESVTSHLDSLAPRLIEALNDQTSVIKQETAVIAMGKLVTSFSVVTAEPYKRFEGLFEGLVRAAQNSDERYLELRLQAIKTLGLLGAVDGTVYRHHLVCINPAREAFSSSAVDYQIPNFSSLEIGESSSLGEEFLEPSDKDRKSIIFEKTYFSLVVRELMNIVRDPSLTYYHLTAVGVAVKTIRLLGLHSAFHADIVVDGLFFRLYQADTGNNVKEALLDHLVTLIGVLGSRMKKNDQQIVQVVKDFFETHAGLCLDILEALAITYSSPEYSGILSVVVPFLLRVVDQELSALTVTGTDDNSGVKATSKTPNQLVKIPKIIPKLINMKEFFGEFRRDIFPMVLMILDSQYVSSDTRRDALLCALYLMTDRDLQEFSGRVIRPVLRLLSGVDMRMQQTIVTALSSILCRLKNGFLPFIIPVKRVVSGFSPSKEGSGKLLKFDEYESLVIRLLKQRPVPSEPSDISSITVKADERVRNRVTNARISSDTNFQVNIQSLETAWALADRNNSSNLTEWMHRLTNELIRQSPSTVIRSCAVLANTYPPIAQELFHIAFYCIWNELFSSTMSYVIVDAPLVSGIEMALQSPELPKNIMISLLNLTEFMDIHDLPLPIDIRVLAKQAQSANMFAKCLRYRELEFNSKNTKPSIECVDSLITVCNQLGLSDRAIGILRHLTSEFPEVEVRPQWLEKLSRWDDAFNAYEDEIGKFRFSSKEDYVPVRNEDWLNSELGRMRCLHALGEYEDLLNNAKSLRSQIKAGDDISDNAMLEMQRLGSYASWMLGEWDSMDELLEGDVKSAETKDVFLSNHLSFFKAVLSIHQKDYVRASSLITDMRSSLSNGISSLLSESYSQAYRAMVTMQILAEMEEVIEFKQMIERISLDHDPYNEGELKYANKDSSDPLMVDINSKKLALIGKWRARLKLAPKDVEVYRQILVIFSWFAVLLVRIFALGGPHSRYGAVGRS